jgi:hypothetical protein
MTRNAPTAMHTGSPRGRDARGRVPRGDFKRSGRTGVSRFERARSPLAREALGQLHELRCRTRASSAGRRDEAESLLLVVFEFRLAAKLSSTRSESAALVITKIGSRHAAGEVRFTRPRQTFRWDYVAHPSSLGDRLQSSSAKRGGRCTVADLGPSRQERIVPSRHDVARMQTETARTRGPTSVSRTRCACFRRKYRVRAV